MLTGNSDQQTAIDAVNEGNIFRFLTKPCPPEMLAKTLNAGIEQYQLITAEKELLENTLNGVTKVLTEVVSMTNPMAFGRANRVRQLVKKMCIELSIDKPWELEIAAMLSQIGCVTIPPDTLSKVYHAKKLSAEETRMVEAYPGIGHDLIENIPRLENVAEIIAYQQKRYDGSGFPAGGPRGDKIPLGARILKVAQEFDTLRVRNVDDNIAFEAMCSRSGAYDPFILAALEIVIDFVEPPGAQRVTLNKLAVGMILDEDLVTKSGALLVGKGQEITAVLQQRMRNFRRSGELNDLDEVLVRNERPYEEDEDSDMETQPLETST